MFPFALALFVGLGITALAMIFDRWLSRVPELWALVLVAVGIAVAWIAGFDMAALWGLDLRASWIGITLTGLVVGGMALFWRHFLGLLGSLFRKVADEAEEIERQHGLRRVA
ncbi:MAG: hypothetical protein KatS3mg011_2068 [Acidimicrobiia bacterium]|jgi:uncharacterized membrane protein|nr:MAG: hypothetical protein KatS3mg011_2068 [Acidimicrobiia bacterium]